MTSTVELTITEQAEEITLEIIDSASNNLALNVKTISTAAHTLSNADSGYILKFTHASGCNITYPEGLALSFNCLLLSGTDGPVAIAGEGTAEVNNFYNELTLAGNGAMASIITEAANQARLTGETQ